MFICKSCNLKKRRNCGRGLCSTCYGIYWRKNMQSSESVSRAKEYNKIYSKNRYMDKFIEFKKGKKERRDQLIAEVREYKESLGCIDCGIKDWRVLDFDHVRDKYKNLAILIRQSTRKKVFEEISKCQVRCANCHRIVTHQRRLLMDKTQ